MCGVVRYMHARIDTQTRDACMRVLCVCALVFGHMYVRMHVYTCTHVQMAMRLYMYNMMSDVCMCSCTPMSISFLLCVGVCFRSCYVH